MADRDDNPKGLLARMLQETGVSHEAYEADHAQGRFTPGKEVTRSAEFQRILALPRRDWEARDQSQVEAYFMEHLRAPGGTQRLRPVQIAGLWEMHAQRGLFTQARTGAGKCVSGDSEIFDAQWGARRQAREIGYVEVPSIAADGHQVIGRSVIYPSGQKPCVRLTLADGSSTVLSTDHPVYTHYGWIAAAKVPPDALVAVPRFAPDPTHFTNATDDEVALIAYLLSDGSVSQAMASFTNGTESVKNDFIRVSWEVLGTEPTSDTPRYLKHLGRLENCTNYSVLGAREFREKWGLHGLAKEKRLHASLWGLPQRQIALFLNRFWACDGYINKRKGYEIVLASEKMIDDLKFLCLRLGIHARKRYKKVRCTNCKDPNKFHSWRLSITGVDGIRFAYMVGPILGKEKACAEILAYWASTERNTNTDIVPVDRKGLRSICDELGFTKYQGSRGRGTPKRPTSPRLTLMNDFAPNGRGWLGRDNFAKLCARYDYKGRLAWLANSDLAWERVSSIEDAGVQPVFDLTVQGTHNFVCDGIVVHNTLLSLLGFIVLSSTRPLLIVPAALRDKTLRDMNRYRKDWLVPPYIRIVSYELLGREQSVNLLEEYNPDAIIMDECHRAKNRSAACVKRIARFVDAHPDVKVVAMSGTIAKRSIKDYAHISNWCLRASSPVPRDFRTLVEWSAALDDQREGNIEPGALIQFCSPEERAEDDPLRGVRRGYRRRLTETPGVIATQESALGVSLRIDPFIVRDRQISHAAAELKRTWERPDGVELVDVFDIWRCIREIGVGMYYRWNPAPPREWREARKAWASAVREILRTNRRGLDSEDPVKKAVDDGHYPHVESILRAWRDIRPVYDPEKNKEAVWLSYGMLEACGKWAKHNPGIIWVQHVEFGKALAKYTGLSYYANQGRDQNNRFIEDHPHGTPMIASIASNSTGVNLQFGWSKNLIVSHPTTGLLAEQLISRTHRDGQPEDEVTVEVAAAIPEALMDFDKACQDARRATDMEGQEQRLCYADITIPPAADRALLWT